MAAATRVPVHLRGPTRAWIRRVLDDYVLSETEFRVLILAGEGWDRGAEAREQVARDGAYIRDRYRSTKPHPAVAVQRDARRDFAKLVAQLSLTQDDVAVACGGEVVGVPQRPRTNGRWTRGASGETVGGCHGRPGLPAPSGRPRNRALGGSHVRDRYTSVRSCRSSPTGGELRWPGSGTGANSRPTTSWRCGWGCVAADART